MLTNLLSSSYAEILAYYRVMKYCYCMKVKSESVSHSVVSNSLQPMDCCSLPGSSVHWIFQPRILDWIVILFSRESSQPRDQTQFYFIAGRLYHLSHQGNLLFLYIAKKGLVFPTSNKWFLIESVIYLFIYFIRRLISLQYCSGFCHTLTWISHGFTYIPHPNPPSHLALYPIPLGLPSAPGPSTWLMYPTWAGDLFHPR